MLAIFSNHLLLQEPSGEWVCGLQLTGSETCAVLLAVVRCGRKPLPASKLILADGDRFRPISIMDAQIAGERTDWRDTRLDQRGRHGSRRPLR